LYRRGFGGYKKMGEGERVNITVTERLRQVY